MSRHDGLSFLRDHVVAAAPCNAPATSLPRMRLARGAALLEVVVALGVLLVAMAMVGVAFRNSDRNARRAVERARATMLAEQVIAYFDTGQFKDEREASGACGDEGPPGWAWSLKLEKDPNVEGMERVTVRIVEGDPDGGADDQRPILVTHFLRAEKKNLNLQDDLGLSEEQIEQITEAIPGGSALFDPTNFDPTSLARLDMDTLVEILPMILQSFGSAAGAMGGGMAGLPGGGSPEQMMNTLARDPSALQALANGAGANGRGQNNGSSQRRGSEAGGSRERFLNRRNGSRQAADTSDSQNGDEQNSGANRNGSSSSRDRFRRAGGSR